MSHKWIVTVILARNMCTYICYVSIYIHFQQQTNRHTKKKWKKKNNFKSFLLFCFLLIHIIFFFTICWQDREISFWGIFVWIKKNLLVNMDNNNEFERRCVWCETISPLVMSTDTIYTFTTCEDYNNDTIIGSHSRTTSCSRVVNK